jgi:hypothetical protein
MAFAQDVLALELPGRVQGQHACQGCSREPIVLPRGTRGEVGISASIFAKVSDGVGRE